MLDLQPDKNTSVFLDGDLSHAETQRRREGGSPASAIPFDRSSWKRVRLGEVCKLCRGVRVVRSQLSQGRYRVYQNSLIPLGHYDKCNTPANTTFVIAAGSAGEIGYCDEPFWAADDCFFLLPNEDVKSKFMYYSLAAQQQYISGLVRRGSVPRLARDIVGNLLLLLPDIAEQDKIIKALTAIDIHISKFQALIDKYEAIKKATVNLLLVPRKNWRQIRLGDIGEVSMCKRILKSQTSATGDVPFFKIGTFGKQPDAFISRTLFEDFKRKFSYPKVGDVLLSAAGTIGRTVVFNGENAYFQDSNIVWIANDESIISNPFLNVVYSQINWQTENGGTVSRLYNANIQNTIVPIPDIGAQKRIVMILDSLDDTIIGLKAQLAKSQAIKQGMMSHFFG